ncbi:MAG: CBS domain-containing protein [Desulfobacterales bacterium]|nr:CBS domain-containing protein [Desulfobacterales bacterium]
MGDEKKVKDIMAHIDEYDTVDTEAPLRNALTVLRNNHEKIKSGAPGTYHKTLFVTDASKKIVGKLSIYDLIRGLVPEPVKKPEVSRAFYSVLSSRALEVADEVGQFQERFKWLHTTFFDLVQNECGKIVKDVMSPIYPVLEEKDGINKAIYVMFKENIRQPLVTRNGKIVGVVNIMDIFPVLLEIATESGF